MPAPRSCCGTQSESLAGNKDADAGCVPSGQEKSPLMHCDAEKAPSEAVVEPPGQATHAAREAAPEPSLKRPSGQLVGGAPAVATKVPAGAGAQEDAPGSEYEPTEQLTQVEASVAPTAALAVPAEQGTQAAEACPGAGL